MSDSTLLLIFDKRRDVFHLNGRECSDIFIFEGLCLNRKLDSSVISEYKQIGSKFIRNCKGMYILSFFDKSDKLLFVSNDWLSKMPLYYFDNEEIFAFSNSFFALFNALKDKKVKLTLSKYAFLSAMSFGSIDMDLTYFEEIKYLKRFQCIILKNKKLIIDSVLPESSCQIKTMREAVLAFDHYFTEAVKIQCEYNSSNGFDQVFTISGGMDSRSVLFKAIALGYIPRKCISYSQAKSVDDLVSKKICEKINTPLLTISLDDGACLKRIDGPIGLNEGMQVYCGSTGAILLNDYGFSVGNSRQIIHVGLLGGELLSFEDKDFQNVSYYNPVFQCNDLVKLTRSFSHRWLFIENNTRCCQNLVRQLSLFSFAYSPFLDEDLYEFLINVNPKYLKKRKLYFKWMRKFIPNNYITTYNKSRIYDPRIIVFFRRTINHIKKSLFKSSRFDMNPFDLWAKQPETKKYLDGEFEKLITYNPGFVSNEQLKKFYDESRCFKKAAIITYLHTVSLLKL